MRNRIDILRDLVSFNGDMATLRNELSRHAWDVDSPFLIITKTQFENVLQKFINNVITHQDLASWADAIECRDDLGFELEWIKELIFKLSSPEIHGAITKEHIQKVVRKLHRDN